MTGNVEHDNIRDSSFNGSSLSVPAQSLISIGILNPMMQNISLQVTLVPATRAIRTSFRSDFLHHSGKRVLDVVGISRAKIGITYNLSEGIN